MKCYDTMTGKYIDVEVSEKIELEYKRSCWREDQQERRYFKRIVCFEDSIEYLNGYTRKLEDSVILKQEVELLYNSIRMLDKRSRRVIQLVYFEGLSKTEAAKVMGLSVSYMGRLLKKIRSRLKVLILKEYDYYVD